MLSLENEERIGQKYVINMRAKTPEKYSATKRFYDTCQPERKSHDVVDQPVLRRNMQKMKYQIRKLTEVNITEASEQSFVPILHE